MARYGCVYKTRAIPSAYSTFFGPFGVSEFSGFSEFSDLDFLGFLDFLDFLGFLDLGFLDFLDFLDLWILNLKIALTQKILIVLWRIFVYSEIWLCLKHTRSMNR